MQPFDFEFLQPDLFSNVTMPDYLFDYFETFDNAFVLTDWSDDFALDEMEFEEYDFVNDETIEQQDDREAAKENNNSQEKLPISEKSEEELFLELKSLNENIDPAVISHIKQILQDITVVEDKLNIKTWQKSDILNWHIEQEQVKDKIAEVLAVIKRADFLTLLDGSYPRSIQIISMLLFYTKGSGLLAEIAAGEGKTTIIGGITLINALEGKRTLVVTSSPVLAQDQLKEIRPFYDLFNITSGENIAATGNKAECYKNTIVYGTVASFIGDLLQGDLNITSYNTIKVDESDNLFIDQGAHIVMLSRPLSRFEYLEGLLVATWARLLHLMSNFYEKDGQMRWASSANKTDEYEVEDADLFLFERLVDYLNILMNGPETQVKIPSHLRDFALGQIKAWARSAITASQLILDADYTFVRQRDGDLDIAPLDRHNTGVTQSNTQLSDGLHQFLQIKHNLKITPETLVIDFMSNKAFFESFKGMVNGASGTPGTEEELDLLHRLYGVDKLSIPTFKRKDFIEEPAMLLHDYDWEETVIAETIKAANAGRPVLLTAETAKQAERFYALLVEVGYDKEKITLYNKNDAKEASGQKWFVDLGDIVASTALSGRGTNLDPSDRVDEKGGLRVFVTYVPQNSRTQAQIFFRTSRQGRKGSARLIISLEDAVRLLSSLYPWYMESIETGHRFTMRELTEWRDLAHRQRLLQDKLCETEMLTLRDGLYKRINRFLDKFKDKSKDQDIYYNAEVAQIKELWGIWRKQLEQVTACNITERLDETSNFTERNANITKQVLESYEKFEEDLEARYQNQTLITNPSYLTIRSLLANSLADADKAISLDGNFSFAAEYAKARLLIPSNNKAGVQASLQNALNNIQDVIIPHYRLPLAFPFVNMSSPLAMQFQDKIAIVSALAENIMADINLVAQTMGNDRIKLTVASYKSLEAVFVDNEHMLDELKEFHMLGLTHFYEIGYYVEPEKKKGLFGNFMAIALGVFQIALAMAITAGTGVFLTGLKAGMIVSGIVDTITSAVITIQGKAIDLVQHLKAVATGLAINVAFAGLQFGLSKLQNVPGLKWINKAMGVGQEVGQEAGKKTIEETAKEMLMRQIKTQVTIMAVTKSIEGLARLGLDAHKDEIDKHIRKRIHKVLESHRAEMLRITAYDSWTGHNYQKQALIHKGHQIIGQHKDKYRKVHEKILRGVAGKTPILGQILEAKDIASTFDEVMSMTDHFCDEFSSKVREVYLSDEELMRAAMQHKDHKVFFNDVSPVVSVMQSTGMLRNSKFNYINNTDAHNATIPLLQALEAANLLPFPGEKEKVKRAYERVAKLDTPENQAQYEQGLRAVEDEVTGVVSKKFIDLIRHGIFAPLAAMAAVPVINAMEAAKAKIQAKHQEKMAAGNGNNPPKTPEQQATERAAKYKEAIKRVENKDDRAKLRKLSQEIESAIPKTTQGKMTVLKYTGQTLLKAAAKYEAFAKEYPLLAKHGMTVLNVVIQTAMAGPAGALNAVRSEMTGRVVGATTEPIVGATIDHFAQKLMSKDSTLTAQEARMLSGAGFIGTNILLQGPKVIKQVLNHVNKPSKFKVITSTVHAPGAKAGIGAKLSGKIKATVGVDAVGGLKHFADKNSARSAIKGTAYYKEGNKFFKDASTGKSKDFRITNRENGNVEMSFFSPARSTGYGKKYILELDKFGNKIREYKQTIDPTGGVLNTKLTGK